MQASLVIVNKGEPTLAETLAATVPLIGGMLQEVVVVDASSGSLDWIRERFPIVRWTDYEQPPGVTTSIAHQRNLGVGLATGDVIVLIDSGCLPEEGWLPHLLAPITDGAEVCTCGPAHATSRSIYSGSRWVGSTVERYVEAAPTINLAFRRDIFERVGGFDESFGHGEDLDFTWRIRDAGFRLRWVPDAAVRHDWGDARRQLRRSYDYGRGWGRLLVKHPARRASTLRSNPVPMVYAVFVSGLILSLRWRAYPLLLLVPFWRARHEEAPLLVVADHLLQGVGVLAHLVRMER